MDKNIQKLINTIQKDNIFMGVISVSGLNLKNAYKSNECKEPDKYNSDSKFIDDLLSEEYIYSVIAMSPFFWEY